MREITEAEQNRLITKNMYLVEPTAARYRGQKGIPFEDLTSVGAMGLVEAGREWRGSGSFKAFCLGRIESRIINFIQAWKHLKPVGESAVGELDKYFYEWQSFFTTPYECWTSLAATPEELLLKFEKLGTDRQALSSAMIGLSDRERKIVWARFLKQPGKTLEAIAQDHKISYAMVVKILNRALIKMFNVIKAIREKEEQLLAS